MRKSKTILKSPNSKTTSTSEARSFRLAVTGVVRSIPAGQVMTYMQVASLAGYPTAARAVGTFCRKNADTTVPCHRVVKSGGVVGEYNGIRGGVAGREAKIKLLQYEGVLFDSRSGKIIS